MDFGFTNDKEQYDAAVKFRQDAIADGWIVEQGPGKEPIERYCHLKKEGWVCHVMSRTYDPGRKWKYEAEVTIWGPDHLQILAPKVYDWAVIQANLRRCTYCKKVDVDVQQVNFAGRCCNDCLSAVRKRTEFRGWTS
jgi:hypothetical protein